MPEAVTNNKFFYTLQERKGRKDKIKATLRKVISPFDLLNFVVNHQERKERKKERKKAIILMPTDDQKQVSGTQGNISIQWRVLGRETFKGPTNRKNKGRKSENTKPQGTTKRSVQEQALVLSLHFCQTFSLLFCTLISFSFLSLIICKVFF